MRTPIVAMLWESWRLTRREVAHRLALGLVGGAAIMVGFATVSSDPRMGSVGATIALVLIVMLHAPLYQSIMKLNGGRFLEGYNPGFPLYLLYTRPVRTAVLVGVPMAYAASSAAAFYFVSALLLRLTFDYPFPLLPVAAWIAALNLVQAAAYWATRSRFVQWAGSMMAFAACIALALRHAFSEALAGSSGEAMLFPHRWPELFDYSLADYAMVVSIGVVSFGLTVAGVARQRRGDAAPAKPQAPDSARPPDWINKLFRFPCPTSSAARAQVWFDMKTSGLPLLTAAVTLAVVIPLLYALSGPIAFARPYVTMLAGGAALSVLLFRGGGNAFGIRRKQGRSYASPFDAAQPCATARLAGLKVLVRALCLFAALVVVSASLWASLSLLSGWAGVPRDAAALLEYVEHHDTGAGFVGALPRQDAALLRGRHAIGVAVGELAWYQQAALVLIAFVGVAVLVASRAALEALWARYPRRLVIAGSLLSLYGLAYVLRARMGQTMWESALDALVRMGPSVAAAALVVATVYLAWSALAERILTPRQVGGAVALSGAFAAAWVMLLQAGGVQIAAVPMADTIRLLWPAALPLMVSLLAPWSLHRIRHT